jgi:hypothetical protein
MALILAEAEYMAANIASCEGIRLHKLLAGLLDQEFVGSCCH